MLRGNFPGHRRYSITHRAVQRLRELVTSMEELDDEGLRDRLDQTLSDAEEQGQAIHTLDAMLGEPQVLIPMTNFGTPLYAIIKEDTVVTVLPQGHGEEILQRGQALESRVASGDAKVPEREEDRWENQRRHRRRELSDPVIIERHGRAPVHTDAPQRSSIRHPSQHDPLAALPSPQQGASHARPVDEIEAALFDALRRGSRAASVAALSEVLRAEPRDADLLEIWNELSTQGVPNHLTVGDLIDACQRADPDARRRSK